MTVETDSDVYILGNQRAELRRLGFQHQIWAAEAIRGWDAAGFGTGDTILDLGSGPGFCSRELAYRVGETGRVIAADFSESYLEFLRRERDLHGLNIDIIHVDLHELSLPAESVDGVFCRWVLAWIDDAKPIVERVVGMIRPGGRFVAQEYYDWGSFGFHPSTPAIERGLEGALASFESAGDVDVGASLPGWFEELGLEVESVRSMTKICTPDDLDWKWPETFLRSYMPRLVDLGFLEKGVSDAALGELDQLLVTPGATCRWPLVTEVIARKPE